MRNVVFNKAFFVVFFGLLFLLSTHHVLLAREDFYVFKDYDSSLNHFLAIDKLGDHDSIYTREDLNNPSPAHGSSLEVVYDPRGYETHYASTISWIISDAETKQEYNLNGAKRLAFYARGKYGGEIVQFDIGNISVDSAARSAASSGPIVLDDIWREYSIDLENLNLSRAKLGFSVSLNRYDNPDGAVIYLDEVRYEFWE
jgi:hypothetical protein